MELSHEDVAAIWLTLKLALTVTVILLVVSTPIALWLSNTHSIMKGPVNALVNMPLVLPPTVIGFYFLIAFSPQGIIGEFTDMFSLPSLAFTFWGLVVASIFYSLPFVVQPLQNAFDSIPTDYYGAAQSMGAGRWDRFWSITLPLAKGSYLTAFVLGFTHTVGEFGVVLMIGGNIPGETSVVSIKIYEHVESLKYGQANNLSILLMLFSFFVLLILYSLQSNKFSIFGTRKSIKNQQA